MRITALLTGRGGSSLKDKNVLKLINKPVLAYPCIEAKKVKLIDDFFVSSDDNKILKTANKYGFKTIKRPKLLARPSSKHHDVLIHSLNELNKKEIYPEILVVLLANAPIIYSKWIKDCIRILIKKNATAVVPVVKDNDKHPLRSKKITNNFLKPFLNSKKKISTNRQDLENCFFICHNFWVIKTSAILKNNGYDPWNFMGKKTLPYIVKNSHDIHTKLDFNICKFIVENNF